MRTFLKQMLMLFFFACAISPAISQEAGSGGQNPFLIVLIQNNANLQTIKDFVSRHPGSISQPQTDREGKNMGYPLHHACLAGRKDVISFLLSVGVNPNTRDSADKTPFHYAVVTTNLETLRLLIKHGAYIHDRNFCRYPPLLEILGACGFETEKQDALMEENLRFLLPLSAITEEDIKTMIDYAKSIRGISPPAVMAARLRKLEIVRQFLVNVGKEHQPLSEFIASFKATEK